MEVVAHGKPGCGVDGQSDTKSDRETGVEGDRGRLRLKQADLPDINRLLETQPQVATSIQTQATF